ncbi:MAG: efflux RND transporter periplasmic adaptor subunit [Proteobacteria bacterium]|nr:efflux RND transporter periplasmic adaptor subunit [Pseudomonadota bacterium]
MKKRLRIIIPLGVIALVVLIYILVVRKNHNGDTIRVSGNIEVIESRLGFRIPGRLEKRLVDEGDDVVEGQVLAILDSSDQRAALDRAQANFAYSESVLEELSTGSRPQELDKAQARKNQARYALDELKKGSRTQDIERARAELERATAALGTAEAQLAQAKSDFERFEALYTNAGISQREYERYKTQYETAKNQNLEAAARVTNARQALSLSEEGPRKEEIKRAESALKQAEAEFALVKIGPRKETLDQATAQMNAAKAALEQARLQLSYTELHSPINGVVLTKAAEVGEYLNPGSAVLVVGDLAHPWVRAYIHEKDLGRLRLKDKAQVKIDAFENRVFTGMVSFISSQAEFTPKAVQTFEERVKLMFRIKIDLENSENYLKPGMPADALIFCPNNWAARP